jgi:hypothetical protein
LDEKKLVQFPSIQSMIKSYSRFRWTETKKWKPAHHADFSKYVFTCSDISKSAHRVLSLATNTLKVDNNCSNL